MTDRELMQQALDALEFIRRWGEPEEAVSKRDSAIAAIRARLAQPDHVHTNDTSKERVHKTEKNEHEPVAWNSKMNVTQWFNAIDKPAYSGVYQRQWADEITYSYWNGKYWLYSGRTVNEAMESTSLSNTQIAIWRGIAK